MTFPGASHRSAGTNPDWWRWIRVQQQGEGGTTETDDGTQDSVSAETWWQLV